ncbi:MAG: hypothetical protein JO345_33205 [Streptosporangiaceae bacterium]|nr:hypothetical protein [Streptosporangiaceae bacterium]
MIDAVFLTIGSLAILAAVIKTADSGRSGHQSGQYLLIVVFVALAMACFLLSYTAQIDADHLYPQLGRLLSNLSVLIAAFALLTLQLTISYSPADAYPRIRRRFQLLVVSLIVMAVSFMTAAPLPRRLGDFGILYRTRPVLLIYIAIYIAFLGTPLAELLSLSWRYAQLARERRYLRLGLRLLAAGSMLGLIYLAEKVIYVIAEAAALQSPLGTDYHCTSPVAPAQCGFEITLTSTAILICVIGATLPVWGPIVATPLRRRWRARTYARLEPLWAALHRAFPQIALAEDPSSHAYQRSELGFLLYRWVIELLDGRLLTSLARHPN